MADSPISSLPAVGNLANGQPDIQTTDLFVLEQNSTAKKLTGEQITKFVDRNVVSYEGEIVASDAAGGARYRNETLTLVLPHGPGIDSVTKTSTRAATDQEISDNDATVDTYTITSQPVRTTNGLTPGTTVGTFQVYNGRNGNGRVNQWAGIESDSNYNIPIAAIRDFLMPVGYIIQTTSASFDPEFLYGGEWSKIEGVVLVGAGQEDVGYRTYTAGQTYGAETVDVDFSNGQADIGFIDSPDNNFTAEKVANVRDTGYDFISQVGTMSWTPVEDAGRTFTSTYAPTQLEGTQTLSTMQRSLAVYIWTRTA